MTQPATDAAGKFDTSRANEYARQSRIALAGYDACHDLSACMLAASLGQSRPANVLVVGAGGTAQEIIAMAALALHCGRSFRADARCCDRTSARQ